MHTYSRTGAYHRARQESCQDAVVHGQKESLEAIVLADGVSTCTESAAGARLAGQILLQELLNRGDRLLNGAEEAPEAALLQPVLAALQRQAAADGKAAEDYSSTLTGAVYDAAAGKLLYFHLGDGILMSADETDVRVLAQPSDSRRGCPVTTTVGADRLAEVRILELPRLQQLLICCDGTWKYFFEGGRVKKQVRTCLLNGDYAGLAACIPAEEFDDSSFIAMDLQHEYEGGEEP